MTRTSDRTEIIFDMIKAGMRTKDIAEANGVSPPHVSQMKRKLFRPELHKQQTKLNNDAQALKRERQQWEQEQTQQKVGA